ncbi:hypothetical protein EI77_04382 [Prosthecobacter fusiformis]|uniref:Uncharacterized protein n=1 Tax=Prosthecobacter fusiformis TaxID=48464 RepID=A0A4R7RLY7_9BACT|nr:hypothetical protein EI77_04382 [Prosthecobacter fusiformis]
MGHVPECTRRVIFGMGLAFLGLSLVSIVPDFVRDKKSAPANFAFFFTNNVR